jgi:uncharacterized coiled-coil DUF342 family protein
MNSSRRPDAVSGHVRGQELDPEQIDRLLADLEKQLEKMPPDVSTTEEIRQEIETLRAMIESFHTNHGWSSDEQRSFRTTAQKIAERLQAMF